MYLKWNFVASVGTAAGTRSPISSRRGVPTTPDQCTARRQGRKSALCVGSSVLRRDHGHKSEHVVAAERLIRPQTHRTDGFSSSDCAGRWSSPQARAEVRRSTGGEALYEAGGHARPLLEMRIFRITLLPPFAATQRSRTARASSTVYWGQYELGKRHKPLGRALKTPDSAADECPAARNTKPASSRARSLDGKHAANSEGYQRTFLEGKGLQTRLRALAGSSVGVGAGRARNADVVGRGSISWSGGAVARGRVP